MACADPCPLSSLREHPRIALLALLIFCCPPVLVLFFSPFLLFASLLAVSIFSFVRCVLQLRDPGVVVVQSRTSVHALNEGIRWAATQGGLREQGAGSLDDDRWLSRPRPGVEGVKLLRVHEYLEDQLRNVVARSNKTRRDDSLLCSFFQGAADEIVDEEQPEDEEQKADRSGDKSSKGFWDQETNQIL